MGAAARAPVDGDPESEKQREQDIKVQNSIKSTFYENEISNSGAITLSRVCYSSASSKYEY